MPTTIREGVENTEQCLIAEKEIAKRYPDAFSWYLPGRSHVWASRACLEDCTHIELVSKEDTPYVACFLRVEGMSVFYPKLIEGVTFVYGYLEDNPKVRASLMEMLKEAHR